MFVDTPGLSRQMIQTNDTVFMGQGLPSKPRKKGKLRCHDCGGDGLHGKKGVKKDWYNIDEDGSATNYICSICYQYRKYNPGFTRRLVEHQRWLLIAKAQADIGEPPPFCPSCGASRQHAKNRFRYHYVKSKGNRRWHPERA